MLYGVLVPAQRVSKVVVDGEDADVGDFFDVAGITKVKQLDILYVESEEDTGGVEYLIVDISEDEDQEGYYVLTLESQGEGAIIEESTLVDVSNDPE